ncbi:hypothetical protein PR048_028067 [Dryococelus australis]|uniref:Uncharacterized protein n=1 Tax=Dryococelus australis TaxID=614101 RepID=A0ABQ9GI62_9NEOP|nr:hypothetical protein PR048_028067 [Dryococelus australis]
MTRDIESARMSGWLLVVEPQWGARGGVCVARRWHQGDRRGRDLRTWQCSTRSECSPCLDSPPPPLPRLWPPKWSTSSAGRQLSWEFSQFSTNSATLCKPQPWCAKLRNLHFLALTAKMAASGGRSCLSLVHHPPVRNDPRVLRAPSITVGFTRRVSRPLVHSHQEHSSTAVISHLTSLAHCQMASAKDCSPLDQGKRRGRSNEPYRSGKRGGSRWVTPLSAGQPTRRQLQHGHESAFEYATNLSCSLWFTSFMFLIVLRRRGSGGVVVRLPASHPGEPGPIPSGVAPVLSQVGIVPDDAACRRDFLGALLFPPPLHSGAAPYCASLHLYRLSRPRASSKCCHAAVEVMKTTADFVSESSRNSVVVTLRQTPYNTAKFKRRHFTSPAFKEFKQFKAMSTGDYHERVRGREGVPLPVFTSPTPASRSLGVHFPHHANRGHPSLLNQAGARAWQCRFHAYVHAPALKHPRTHTRTHTHTHSHARSRVASSVDSASIQPNSPATLARTQAEPQPGPARSRRAHLVGRRERNFLGPADDERGALLSYASPSATPAIMAFRQDYLRAYAMSGGWGANWPLIGQLRSSHLHARFPPRQTGFNPRPGHRIFASGNHRTMPLVGGFSRGSPVSPSPSFRRRSIFTSITLIGSQDLAVKSRPNLFTHSSHLTGRNEVRMEQHRNIRTGETRDSRENPPTSDIVRSRFSLAKIRGLNPLRLGRRRAV